MKKNILFALSILSIILGVQTVFSKTSHRNNSENLNLEQVLSSSVYLNRGTMEVRDLKDSYDFEGVYIMAEGVRCDATFEITFNGTKRTDIHVPGADPTYRLAVSGKGINQISFKHVSGCDVRIFKVWLEVNQRRTTHRWQTDEAGKQYANLAIELISALDEIADHMDKSEYYVTLEPIKLKAGVLYATANGMGGGISSLRILFEIYSLLEAQICEIDQQMRSDAHFWLAVELLALKEKIRNYLL